ncbi:hypothetical protein OAV88_04325, partial [bacterium]|nr:hypothetical protein [bacterium]
MMFFDDGGLFVAFLDYYNYSYLSTNYISVFLCVYMQMCVYNKLMCDKKIQHLRRQKSVDFQFKKMSDLFRSYSYLFFFFCTVFSHLLHTT